MIAPFAEQPRAVTLGADRGYDTADFVEELRTFNMKPHVAQNIGNAAPRSIGAPTAMQVIPPAPGLEKIIEEAFGWIKTIAGLRKAKIRGLAKGRLGLHLCGGRLQFDSVTQAA